MISACRGRLAHWYEPGQRRAGTNRTLTVKTTDPLFASFFLARQAEADKSVQEKGTEKRVALSPETFVSTIHGAP